jgi:hypothetical protein
MPVSGIKVISGLLVDLECELFKQWLIALNLEIRGKHTPTTMLYLVSPILLFVSLITNWKLPVRVV